MFQQAFSNHLEKNKKVKFQQRNGLQEVPSENYVTQNCSQQDKSQRNIKIYHN